MFVFWHVDTYFRYAYKWFLILCVAVCLQDDALANVRSMAIQLKELEEEKDRTERRHQILQKSLGDVEEGRGD